MKYWNLKNHTNGLVKDLPILLVCYLTLKNIFICTTAASVMVEVTVQSPIETLDHQQAAAYRSTYCTRTGGLR